MELITEPDVYQPSIDNCGNYIDKVPTFSSRKHGGIRCPCGSRKDKVYETHTIFASHIKTKCHQKWLENLNTNRSNFYVENEENKSTIQNQRLIIAKLERETQNLRMTVEYLTQQLVAKQNPTVNNLLNFDS